MKRFLTPFTLTLTGIFAAIFVYIGMRLAEGWLEWAVLLAVFLLSWSLPAIYWTSDREELTRGDILFQQVGFVSMGLLSWIWFLTLLRDAAILLLKALSGPGIPEAWNGPATFAAACILTGAGILNARKGLRVREVNIAIPGLPEELSGLRIAQITDLHIGAMIGEKYVAAVVSRVKEAQPDLTVLTGDIVDGNIKDHLKEASLLGELSPIGRVFYVPGNHEYYWGMEAWVRLLAERGLKPLLNRGENIQFHGKNVWIGGITDPTASVKDLGGEPDIRGAARGSDASDFRILLSHRPGVAKDASILGFGLQLSGHTHGGQFFPWTSVVRLFHKHYLGLSREGDTWVYVGPGTGSWGPPLRTGTTPEIGLIKLVRPYPQSR